MNENTTKKLKIGITVGDINGIGLEVILKTLSDKRIVQLCTPVIYGAAKVVSYHKNVAKINQLNFNNVQSIDQVKENALNVINCWEDIVKITLGQCTEEGGKYAYMALQQATEDLKNGHLDALVTAPINKEAMKMAGFEHTGHTEYLTQVLGAKESLMLMVHENLRVGLVTNHLPISLVAPAIKQELVLQKIEIMHKTLCMDFGISKPVIAVLGLNPHAGDGGVIGEEDKAIIFPAIEAAKAKGILAIGPYPADGLFGSKNYSNFDGILAMYHDQGLAPFKAMAFGGGVNFTAGLSAIRTSPDHGTGYDIVGKVIADPSSFRQALYLAIDAARARANYLELTANPLKEASAKDLAEMEENNKKNYRKKRDNRPVKKEDARPVEKEKQPVAKDIAPKEAPKSIEKKEKREVIAKEKKVEKKPEVVQKEAPKKQLTIEERLALAEAKKKAVVEKEARVEAKEVVVVEPKKEEIVANEDKNA